MHCEVTLSLPLDTLSCTMLPLSTLTFLNYDKVERERSALHDIALSNNTLFTFSYPLLHYATFTYFNVSGLQKKGERGKGGCNREWH